MTPRECPKCGAEMELEGEDEHVKVAYWACTYCDYTELADISDAPDVDGAP